jgi:hypothetical protein
MKSKVQAWTLFISISNNVLKYLWVVRGVVNEPSPRETGQLDH